MSTINFQDIIGRFESGRNSANAANEARFTEMKGLLQSLGARNTASYDRILQNQASQGQSAVRDVQDRARQASASAAQNLTSRGLGNTTITASVERGIASDAQRARQAIGERVAAQRASTLQNQIGTDLQTTGLLASAIERRNDLGPDLSAYAQLLSQAAQAGAGGTGSGGRTRTFIGPGSSSFGRLQRGSGGGGSGRTGVTSVGGGAGGGSQVSVSPPTSSIPQAAAPNAPAANNSPASDQRAMRGRIFATQAEAQAYASRHENAAISARPSADGKTYYNVTVYG